MRQVEEKYIKSGKVRLGFWQFAFLGDESTWAAEAAECAEEQKKFWEYHDKLFTSQAGENQGAFNKDKLKGFAATLGLDSTKFNECLDSGKYASAVQEQGQIASQLGVQSTPAFLVNGIPLTGAQPYENFQKIIEAQLKPAP